MDNFLYNTFDERKMNIEDFKWLFISLKTLEEERKWISNLAFLNNPGETANTIDDYVSTHFEYHTTSWE
jgi:hypothetical protein